MDFGFYEVDAWGDVVANTAAAPQYCTLSGVAKRNSDNAPYAVANEFICGRLGLMIGLPVPPGVVTTTDDEELAYISLRFGPRGELPPPIIPEHFAEDNPSITAGVIAFDCWIGNEDRHTSNVAYVRGQPQRPATVFDHSHALLGYTSGGGIERLQSRKDDPFITGSLPPYIKSSKEFNDWTGRISRVSDEQIKDICETVARPQGITVRECTAAAAFLVYRKDRITEKILAAKGGMPNVQQWELEAS